MNKCIFVGNLTRDFEYRVGQSGSVARGSMALNRGKDKDGKDRGADFISLVAFGNTADLLDKYGVKGRRFAFECNVNTGSYEKDGHKVYTTDFVIDRVEFVDSKKEEQKEEPTYSDDFMDIPDDIAEALPFN